MSKKYNIIYTDSPWNYKDNANAGKRGAIHKYPTMKDNDILTLPIKEISAENSALFLWITCPKLDIGLAAIKEYGFKFKGVAFTWIKTNKRNQDSFFFGMGNYSRGNTELCLLGIKGKPKVLSHSVHQIIKSPIQEHSKKPDVARDKIIQLFGDLPRIELFARTITPGWDCLGNEIDGKDIRDSLNNIINVD